MHDPLQDDDPPTTLEVADYLRDLSRELAAIARGAGLWRVAIALEEAEREAARTVAGNTDESAA